MTARDHKKNRATAGRPQGGDRVDGGFWRSWRLSYQIIIVLLPSCHLPAAGLPPQNLQMCLSGHWPWSNKSSGWCLIWTFSLNLGSCHAVCKKCYCLLPITKPPHGYLQNWLKNLHLVVTFESLKIILNCRGNQCRDLKMSVMSSLLSTWASECLCFLKSTLSGNMYQEVPEHVVLWWQICWF